MPISRCGAVETPTIPQPTSAIGSPAYTPAPTGSSAGAACPEVAERPGAGPPFIQGAGAAETGVPPVLAETAAGAALASAAAGDSSVRVMTYVVGRRRI